MIARTATSPAVWTASGLPSKTTTSSAGTGTRTAARRLTPPAGSNCLPVGSRSTTPSSFPKLWRQTLTFKCFAKGFFEYAAGRAKQRRADKCYFEEMVTAMDANNGDVREGLVALIKNPAFV